VTTYPKNRTHEECELRGWPAWYVVRTIPSGKPYYLFGIGDVLAMTDEGDLLIRSTRADRLADVIQTIEEDRRGYARMWNARPNHRIEVWGWGKQKRTDRGGKRRMIWTPTIHKVTL